MRNSKGERDVVGVQTAARGMSQVPFGASIVRVQSIYMLAALRNRVLVITSRILPVRMPSTRWR